MHAIESDRLSGIESRVVNDSLTEYWIYYPKSRFRFYKLIKLIRAGLAGVRHIFIVNGKPDLVVLSVIYPAGILALWVSYLYSLPLVVNEHWTGYKNEDGSFGGVFMKSIVRLVSHRAKAIIALNEVMAKAMKRCGLTGHYYYIPNVVDFSVIPEKADSKRGPLFRFIHVSGLDDRQKNITGLLTAIARLSEKRQDFVFDIVGGDEGIEKYMEMSNRLNIHLSVTFMGPLPHEAVMQKMSKADAFVLFSNFENLPCVILEAMAVGLPVIATETGDMNQWINKKNGTLISIGDLAALVNAMEQMIENIDQYDSNLIKEDIFERCNPNVIGQSFYKIYKSVLQSS